MNDEALIEGPKRGITVVALLSAALALLDISIVNVALTDIRASFGVALDEIGWVSTSYMTANVIVIPMTGWLQRRMGFRNCFVASLLIFTVASGLCGLAWNMPSLTVFRALQGIGGGAIIPTAQTILLGRYPRKEHSMASALFGLAAITGPLLGPAVGGYLIEVASWHWVFFINVPIGLVTAWLASRVIHQRQASVSWGRPDFFGFALLAVGMASLQYVLEEGARHDWWQDGAIVVFSVLAAIALITLLVHELETRAPLVELRVFADRGYAAGTMLNGLAGMGLFSSAYLFSLYCGAVMHYKALDIGLVFMAGACLQLVLMPVLGKLGARIDNRIILMAGLLLMLGSFWQNSLLDERANFLRLAIPQVFRSLGLSCAFVALSVLTLSALPNQQRGNATGLFNLTRELGGSFGTAWMGTLLAHRYRVHLEHLASDANYADFREQFELTGQPLPLGGLDLPLFGVAQALDRVSLRALILAFNECFAAMAVLAGLGMFVVLLLPFKRPSPGGLSH